MNTNLHFVRRRLLPFVFATLILVISFAQSKTVTGRIVDQVTGKPRQDNTVIVKGPAQTTTSNSAVWFIITAPSPSSFLSVGCIIMAPGKYKQEVDLRRPGMNKHPVI